MKITQPSSGAVILGTTLGGDVSGSLPGAVTVEAVNGLPPSWKNPVRVATTTAGTLTTSFEDGDTVDGIALVEGDRILIKNQASASENGIYVVNFAGSPTRATDMDESDEVVGAAVYVGEGTTNGATIWINTNTTPPVIDTDAITFAQFNTASGSLGSITDGITTVAPVTTLDVWPHGLSGATPSATLMDERLVTVGAAGAAYEFDLANGNVFDLTLSDDPDLTIAAGAVAGYPERLVIYLRQPNPIGGGPYVVNSWDAAIVWQAADGTPTGSAPTLFTAAGAVDTFVLISHDGGTTWGGFHGSGGGGGGTPATTVESETTFGITPAVGTDTEYARQDHTHGSPGEAAVRDIGRWEYVFMDGEIVLDGDDGLMMWVGG